MSIDRLGGRVSYLRQRSAKKGRLWREFKKQKEAKILFLFLDPPEMRDFSFFSSWTIRYDTIREDKDEDKDKDKFTQDTTTDDDESHQIRQYNTR